jgi:feruloyl-CoA synthase
MPGYWRDPEKTRAAFDDEGYYRMGDAVRLIDPNNPAKGIEFNGRIAEDFKMSSGTWVNVGPLRLRVIEHGALLVRDVVIAGHDRDYLSALIIPDVEACRKYCPELSAEATAGEVLASPRVRAEFQKILDALAAKSTGSANRIVRAILLEEPLSADGGEVTDKGSVNQRAVIDRRAAIVEECYEVECSARILQIRSGE